MMKEFNAVEAARFLARLRKGETPQCPHCEKGKVISDFSPETAHFFYCTECDFKIILN